MTNLTEYSPADGVATVTMDDGRVNALSSAMLESVAGRLRQAEADDAIVLLTGREQTFSAGFDLRCPPERFLEMVADGARLAEQLLAYPRPVVAACNGNAIAMGAFVLLACDVRVGADAGKIGLNEVAIGLTVPWFGLELARHRLTPPYFDRCTITGTILSPEEARTAGFLDAVVPAEAVLETAAATAAALAGGRRRSARRHQGARAGGSSRRHPRRARPFYRRARGLAIARRPRTAEGRAARCSPSARQRRAGAPSRRVA